MLSNREIAICFWILALIVFALVKRDIRGAVFTFLSTMLTGLLGRVLLIMVGYISVLVYALSRVGFWSCWMLKDTAVWLVFSAMVLAYRSPTEAKDRTWFINIIKDSIKILVLIQFLSWRYTFGLLAEIVLFFLLMLLGAISAVAETEAKYTPVKRFVDCVVCILGFVMLYHAIVGAYQDYAQLAALDTVKDLLLVPILTCGFLPFLYLLAVYAAYDKIFSRLRMGRAARQGLVSLSERFIICLCGINLRTLNQFYARSVRSLMGVGSKRELFTLLADCLEPPGASLD